MDRGSTCLCYWCDGNKAVEAWCAGETERGRRGHAERREAGVSRYLENYHHDNLHSLT